MFPKSTWSEAENMVENIIPLLKIKSGVKILDLCCGMGRHSIEFARQGFQVTGVDLTLSYLKIAKEYAKEKEVNIEFIQEDMRTFCRANTFDVIVNLFSSFGYFEDKNDDCQVIKNVYTSLKPNGLFLIDIFSKEILARIFKERNWYEVDGNITLEERKITKNWSWIEERRIFIKNGEKREFTMSLRIYSAIELMTLLEDCGFNRIDVFGDLKGAPYDHTAKRLIMVAYK